jgi:hypothetical protein
MDIWCFHSSYHASKLISQPRPPPFPSLPQHSTQLIILVDHSASRRDHQLHIICLKSTWGQVGGAPGSTVGADPPSQVSCQGTAVSSLHWGLENVIILGWLQLELNLSPVFFTLNSNKWPQIRILIIYYIVFYIFVIFGFDFCWHSF